MIRAIAFLLSVTLVAACGGDGRGSQYSSARAQVPQATYIPVTPGAVPVAPDGTPLSAEPLLVPTVTVGQAAPVPAPAVAPAAPAPAPAPIPVTPAAATAPATSAAVVMTPQPVRRFATGPIFAACRKAGRKAASRARCGCVQWVADQELTAAQQKRGAGYFSNQHALQEVRQSDNAANERFWKAWKAYGQSAAQQCDAS